MSNADFSDRLLSGGLRLAIVCPYDLARPGGVQVHIRDIAKALDARGHLVTVIAPSQSDHGFPVAVETIGRRRAVVFNQTEMDLTWATGDKWRSLRRRLQSTDFDVVHLHTPWDLVMPLQVLLACRGPLRIATCHDTPPDTPAGAITRMVFRQLSRVLSWRLDGYMAVSQAPARHLYRHPRKPFALMPPSVDLSDYQGMARLPRRTENGLCQILFLGRLDPRKGIEYLIDAYTNLKRDGAPVGLTVAGDGDRMAWLRSTITTRELRDVTLLGAVSESGKRAAYAAADIFCAPAPHGESFGIVLVEAMQSGLPVVAAANPGYRTVLSAKAAECLAEPRNVADLTHKLGLLVGSPERREALAQWGREEAQKYDVSAWIDPLLAFYGRAWEVRAHKNANDSP